MQIVLFGLDRIRQAVPFQDSTRVALSYAPTAMHEMAETHDTPARPSLPAGAEEIDQAVPFHDSMRVLLAPPMT